MGNRNELIAQVQYALDNPPERAYTPLSPSSSKRWLTCPGSVRRIEQAQYKEGAPKRHTSKGTVAHAIGETCLIHTVEPELFKGEVFRYDGFNFKVDQEMVDAVNVYVEYVRDWIEMAGESAFMLVEQYVSLKHLGIEGMNGGTSDCILVDPKNRVAEAVDYKDGALMVSVDGNSQALKYLIGAIEKLFDETVVEDLSEWKFYTTIVQPNGIYSDEPVRSQLYTYGEIINWQTNVLIPGALRTQDPDAPLVPDEEGCQFCPVAANADCPEHHKLVNALAVKDFADCIEEDVDPVDTVFPDPARIPHEKKLVILQYANLIRGFLKKLEHHVLKEIDGGCKDYADEYKIVRSITRRRFTEDALDPDFSPILDYLDEDQIFVKKLRGIGEIEKLLKQVVDKKEAATLISEWTDKPEGSITLAPCSDRRKEVEPTAVSDFAGLED